MSQFISGVKNAETPPIISPPRKEIIIPKLRRILKTTNQQKPNLRWKQQQVLIQLCQKLSDKQFNQLHLRNVIQMQRQFFKLKKKLKKSIKHESIEQMWNRKGKTHQRGLKLDKISSENVDLAKKYTFKISQKMNCTRQAQQIQIEKSNYIKWLDKSNNNILLSPNYNKMLFLFEKIKKVEDLNKFSDKLQLITTQRSPSFNPVIYKPQNNLSYKSCLKKLR